MKRFLVSAFIAVLFFILLAPVFGIEVSACIAGLGLSINLFAPAQQQPALYSSLTGIYGKGGGGGANAGMAGRGRVGVVTNDLDRAALEDLYAHPVYGKFAAKTQPGKLILESIINNSDSTLVFKTFDQGVATQPVEVILDRNDAFLVTSVALGIVDYSRTLGQTDRVPEFYPNVTAFGATAAGFLNSVYQTGRLRMTIGNEEKIKNLHCTELLSIPQTQKSASTNYSQYMVDDVYHRLNPSVILDGSGTNDITLPYKTYAGWAGGTSATSGNVICARLFLRGFLMVGGSANT